MIDDSKKLGTAYGIFTCLANILNTLMAMFVTWIQDNTHKDHGFFWVEIFFIIFIVLSLLSVLAVHYADVKYRNGMLSSSDPYGKLAEF